MAFTTTLDSLKNRVYSDDRELKRLTKRLQDLITERRDVELEELDDEKENIYELNDLRYKTTNIGDCININGIKFYVKDKIFRPSNGKVYYHIIPLEPLFGIYYNNKNRINRIMYLLMQKIDIDCDFNIENYTVEQPPRKTGRCIPLKPEFVIYRCNGENVLE